MVPNRRPHPQFLTCHDVVFGTSPLDKVPIPSFRSARLRPRSRQCCAGGKAGGFRVRVPGHALRDFDAAFVKARFKRCSGPFHKPKAKSPSSTVW